MIESLLPTRYRHPVLDTGSRFSELIAPVSGTPHQVRGDALRYVSAHPARTSASKSG